VETNAVRNGGSDRGSVFIRTTININAIQQSICYIIIFINFGVKYARCI
jgi:hypothetical protein